MKLKKYNVLAVGEVLFDVIGDEYKLGGAPFNVAAHMSVLGNSSSILSAVGQDALGDQIIREAEQLRVNTDWIDRNHEKSTGTVKVSFRENEPQYDIVEDVAWDYLRVDFGELNEQDWDVVAFGSLAQRSAHNKAFYGSLFDQLQAKWKYFDCNLRQNYYDSQVIKDSLLYANIAKFNEHEIGLVSELLYDQSLAPRVFAEKLHQDFEIELVVYTWGKEGSRAWYQDRFYSKESIPVDTVDTIGAGDAFSAGFLQSWLRGKEVEEALQDGNRLGGYVASRSGAIPEYDGEIRSYFADQV